jgi:hypothetical protein
MGHFGSVTTSQKERDGRALKPFPGMGDPRFPVQLIAEPPPN